MKRNNERKKESINHIYLDTTPTMAPKSDGYHYFSKNAATPRATNITSSPLRSYKLGGESVVYKNRCNGLLLSLFNWGNIRLGFLKPFFY